MEKRIKEIDKMAESIYKTNKGFATWKEHIIFRSLPVYPLIAKTKKHITDSIQIALFILKQTSSDYVLINLPNYGNLGDQAIAVAEIQMFNSLGLKALPVDEGIIQTLGDRFYKHIIESKTIIICGGGFSGCLWPE